MFTMQRIDERSLVKAEKPELVLLDTPELNAETPAHLLDDDITPIARLFARNTGAMPALGAGRDRGLDTDHRRLRAHAARLDDRRAEAGVRDRHRDRRDRMRRQRPRLLSRSRPARCCGGTARSAACAGPACGSATCCDNASCCRRRSTPATTARTSISTARDRRSHAACRSTRRWRRKRWWPSRSTASPCPSLHGGPLRLVAPGYPGASFQKWLTRVEVRDREHDGERMMDGHYRMPRAPLRHGEPFDHAQFEIITDMPVKSLITAPQDGFSAHGGRAAADSRPRLERAHAGRDGRAVVRRRRIVARGESRPRAAAASPGGDFRSRSPGRRAARSRSSRAPPTSNGRAQPLESVPWNPRGYLQQHVPSGARDIG